MNKNHEIEVRERWSNADAYREHTEKNSPKEPWEKTYQ